jgi:hypothetical protein
MLNVDEKNGTESTIASSVNSSTYSLIDNNHFLKTKEESNGNLQCFSTLKKGSHRKMESNSDGDLKNLFYLTPNYSESVMETNNNEEIISKRESSLTMSALPAVKFASSQTGANTITKSRSYCSCEKVIETPPKETLHISPATSYGSIAEPLLFVTSKLSDLERAKAKQFSTTSEIYSPSRSATVPVLPSLVTSSNQLKTQKSIPSVVFFFYFILFDICRLNHQVKQQNVHLILLNRQKHSLPFHFLLGQPQLLIIH